MDGRLRNIFAQEDKNFFDFIVERENTIFLQKWNDKMENFQFNKTLFDNIRRSLIFTENKGKYN